MGKVSLKSHPGNEGPVRKKGGGGKKRGEGMGGKTPVTCK